MDVINAYFDQNPAFLADHHLASFQHYCYRDIPRILSTPIQVENGQLYLGGKNGTLLRYVRPKQFPNEARLDNKTYSFQLYAGVELVHKKGVSQLGEVNLGHFPAMVNSSICLLHKVPRAARDVLGECRSDPGGYFIIEGKEVVLAPLEELAATVVHAGANSAEFGQVRVEKLADTETEMRGQVVVHLPNVGAAIPLFVLMRAFGVVSDKDIIRRCLLGQNEDLNEYFVPSVHDAGKIFTRTAALHFISLFVKGRTPVSVVRVLSGIFPLERWADKAYMLGHMVQKMLFVEMGMRAPSAPHSYANKRFRSSGAQLADKFEEAYAAYGLKASSADMGVFHPFTNITTPLQRGSFVAMLASLRALPPAPVHPTQWGVLDPTDNGQLAVLARVTTGVKGSAVLDLVKELLVPMGAGVKVVVNGVWSACTKAPAHLLHVLREQRRKGERAFWDEVNVAWEVLEDALYICTDAGRLQWPLFYVASDGSLPSTDGWAWGMPGVVEYLDAVEANSSWIALNRSALQKRHTHVEIHGSVLLGVGGNLVAFPEHNAVERTTLACEHARAAVSLYHTNYANRIDPEAFVLQYGQLPLLKSVYHAPCEEHPNGVNVMLAVMTSGSADCITVNQAAVDRGMFHVTQFLGYEAGELGGTFGPLAEEGAELAGETTVIGMAGGGVVHKGGGVVDRRYMSAGPRGTRVAKVRVRRAVPVAMGASFSSRAGLRGACGALVREQDMPFTRTGLRPDLIINPHAIPDRMALGQLLEALMGKAHLVQGTFGDATAFAGGNKVVDYCAALKKIGLHPEGNEVLYDGFSGEVLEGDIFMGPTYYMRLPPPADARSQARGAVEFTTRQPLEGVQVGEMERDALVAHGMTQSVRDAYMARGDAATMLVDAVTGTPALRNEALGVTLAPSVDGPLQFDGGMRLDSHRVGENAFTTVRVPHAFKTLVHELAAMNVQVRLVTAPARMGDAVVATAREQFRNMPLDTPAVADNELYASESGPCFDLAHLYTYRERMAPTIFPYVTTREELGRIMVSSYNIAPTAGYVSRHNKDKLADPMHARLDVWGSARITSLYFFNKMRTGVFVRIKNNRVHNFNPLYNLDYTNDFYARLSLDGATVAAPAAMDEFLKQMRKKQAPRNWQATNCVLRAETYPSDLYLAQLYDMVVETCGRRKVGDCMFFMNRQEAPHLGANWTEAFESVYGENKPLDKRWRLKEAAPRPFLPVLSQCTSAAHADIAIPTANDWDSITQKKFATYKAGALVCGNSSPNVKEVGWAQRTGVVHWKDAQLPIFYWRGVAAGCGSTKETNPRMNLVHLSTKNAPDPDNPAQNPLQTGILDARITRFSERVKAAAVGDFTVLSYTPALDVTGQIPLEEQAAKFRFTVNVEGNAAAYRYGALFKYGFCVLNVKSKYQLWFERLTGYDGKPLLVGGQVTSEDVETFAYLEILPDLSNFTETVKWCLENDEKCRKVAENGVNFYKKYFTKEFVYDYMADVFNGISAAFTETVQVDEKVRKEEMSRFKSAPKWKRTEFSPVPNAPLTKTVVLIPYQDQAKELNFWLKQPQHKGLNVLVVECDELNRGAMLNAGFDYVARHAPELTEFVMQDPDVVFAPDFVRDYYGLDGKALVDLGTAGKKRGAYKFSKDAYLKFNGFPNTFVKGEGDALAARVGEMEVFRPLKWEGDEKEKAFPEDLVLDQVNWKMNGVNTVQYEVIEHVLLNKSPNIRKIKVRLSPQVSLREIEIREPELPPGPSEAQAESEDLEKMPPIEFTDLGGGAVDDMHLGVIDLIGGASVVNIIDGGGIKLEAMPVLENQKSLDSSRSSVKTIAYTEK